MADRFSELSENEWLNNYWTQLSQNIVICQCLPDHDILLNVVQ